MTKLPAQLGNYRLTRLVHSGAQTEVWQAMTISMNEPRVLKIQSPQARSATEVAKRLKHEYLVASGLRHPHAVRVYECGTDRGFAFLAMERFSGRSLRQLLAEKDRARLTDGLPGLVERACAALAHLHQSGWIYRALKPASFLINDDQQLRLIDYSLAIPLRKRGLGLWKADAKLVGSAYYIAPEQIRRQSLDHRADIYSLGCLLFELIEGRVPYTGVSASDLLNKHLRAKPPRITTRSKYVTDALADLVCAMMAKQPSQRPDDLLVVGHELRRVFQQADPVDWSLQLSGFEGDQPWFEQLSGAASEGLDRLRRGDDKTAGQPRPGKATALARRFAAPLIRLARKRSVQVAAGLLLILWIGWAAVRSESYSAEQQVLESFQQVLSRIEASPAAADASESPADQRQDLQEMARRALETRERLLPTIDARRPVWMELYWASQALPQAVSEFHQATTLPSRSLTSLKVHLGNAQRYLNRDQEAQRARGPLGLKWIYESDGFFWGIVGLDVLGAAWIVKLLLTSRRKRTSAGSI